MARKSLKLWAWQSKATGELATVPTMYGGWSNLCTAPNRRVARIRGVNTETHRLVRIEVRVIK